MASSSPCQKSPQQRTPTSTIFCSSAVFRVLLVYVVVSAVLWDVASAQDFYEDKKNDPNNRPFYMGSRYGRSGQQTKVQVAPRTDRFFMGSRYGKRGANFPENDETNPSDLPVEEGARAGAQGRVEALLGLGLGEPLKPALSCTPMGVGNLYRCYHRETTPSR